MYLEKSTRTFVTPEIEAKIEANLSEFEAKERELAKAQGELDRFLTRKERDEGELNRYQRDMKEITTEAGRARKSPPPVVSGETPKGGGTGKA